MQQEIEDMYLVRKMSCQEIGNLLGKSKRTIVRLLHKLGIPVRPPGPDRHNELRDVEWLTRQYVDLGKSTTQIGRDLDAQPRVVCHWLKVLGIQARPVGFHDPFAAPGTIPKPTGESVKRNRSLRNSKQSKDWVKAVKLRDNWICLDCGDVGIHAHHIKPWRDHPELRYEISNGVTLCVPCHEKKHKRKFPDWVHQQAEIAKSTSPLAIG